MIATAMRAVPTFDEFSQIRLTQRFEDLGFLEFRPTDLVPIVYLENGKRVLAGARWGFVPGLADASRGRHPINARSETIATNAMFRSAFASSRCLLPAGGFFEPKGARGTRHRPQYFFCRPDESLFAMAGIWSRAAATQPDSSGNTCALLTTTPNHIVGEIHDRMPVILHPDDYDTWLNDATPIPMLQRLMQPAPDADFTCQPETPAEKIEPGLFD